MIKNSDISMIYIDHNVMQGVKVVKQILRETTKPTLQGCTG